MNSINLKLLQTFRTAAEQGSFRKAAEIGNRSPSAISMQIKDLEEQIGLNLFIRTPHRAILTPEGEILYEEVQKAMEGVQIGLDKLASISAGRKGRVRIGCAPTLAHSRLPSILATFKIRYPRSVVRVKETSPKEGLALLADRSVEFYIGPEFPNLSEFDFLPIMEDRIFACIPAELDTGQSEVWLSKLGDAPIILLDQQTAIRSVIDSIIEEADEKLNIQYEVQSGHTASAMAAMGLGIAILPNIASRGFSNENFRIVPIAEKGAQRLIGITTVKGQVQNSYSEQLIKLIYQDLKTF